MNKLLSLYTREELEQFFNAGKIMIFSYRRCGELKFIPTNEKGFGIQEYEKSLKKNGIPYIGRGRHIFTTVKSFQKILTYNS